jgi:hypothetical protein
MSTFLQSQGPNANVGFDIDNQTFQTNSMSYGDYDQLVSAKVSGFGGSYIIDEGKDRPEMVYNESTVGGERVYNLEAMLETNKSNAMGDMIDIVNNGRVTDSTGGNPTPSHMSGETVPIGTVMRMDNQETSIKGMLEDNAVNTVLFSPENMEALQDGIQYGVYKRTGKRIGEQSPQELYMVIRSVMLQHANFQTSQEAVVEEVRRLNTKILLSCVDNVSSNVLQYVQYLKDIETLPTPMDRPSYVDKPVNYTFDISNLLKP